MILLYNLGIRLYAFGIRVASLWNSKASKWHNGRKDWRNQLKQLPEKSARRIWFHISSLGEYEQAKPLLKLLSEENSLIITFFSPSGYDVKKENPFTKHVFYLPLDTNKNAKDFIDLVKPDAAIFVKYDLWYHYISTLHSLNIPAVLISALFKPKQVYFKWYGTFFRTLLKKLSWIYTQDEYSVDLLRTINYHHALSAGDTRVDSVEHNTRDVKILPELKLALGDERVLIVGSSYDQEEELIKQLIENKVWTDKVVLAPHNIDELHLSRISKRFGSTCIRFSEWDRQVESIPQVLVIDNIGMLKQLYALSTLAFIGGGFGKTVHNTLEPAAFGIPIIFGPHFEKFTEAVEMVKRGGAFSIRNYETLADTITSLLNDDNMHVAGAKNRKYIEENTEATKKVFDHLSSLLSKTES